MDDQNKSKAQLIKDLAELKKKYKDQAGESEKLLHLMARNYPHSYISIIEKDLSIGYTAGREFGRQGLNPDDFIGMTLDEVFGEHTEVVKKHYLETFKGEEREFQLFINNQHQRYRTVPLVNESGEIERIMAVVENITDQVKAEQSARVNIERYKLLFETSSDAIFIANPETGMMIDCNPAAERLTGRSSRELKNLHQSELHPPEKSDYYKSEFAKAVKSKGQLFGGMEILHKDGRRIPVEISSGGITLETGTALHYGIFRDVSKRVADEQRILRDQENLSALINNTDGHIWSVDRSFRLILGNAAFDESISSWRGKSFQPGDSVINDCFPEKSLEMWKNLYQRSLMGETFSIELPSASGGDDSLMEYRFSPIISHAGEITGVTVFGRNISDRKKAEMELADSREKYQLYFDHSPVGYQSLDENGCILDVNQTWLNLLGYEKEEVLGKWFGDFLHPEEKELFRQRFSTLIQSTETVRGVVVSLRLKSGQLMTAEYTVRIGRDNQGNFLRTHCVFQDISERIKAEASLKESEIKFRSYIENSPYGIFLWDGNGRFQDANAAACKMSGYAYRDLLELSITDVVLEESRTEALDEFENLIARGCSSIELPFRQKSGEKIFCSVDSVRLGPDKYLGFVQDVTSRKLAEIEREKLQEQLTQAQKMEAIGRLAGGVAHDFNNLLTAIQGFSELLQSALAPGDPLKKDVEEIQKAADSAASLTSQLLTFSRKQIASPKVLDLNKKISSSEKMLRRIIGEDINFTFLPGADTGNVFIDPGQVDQILINLIINSRDAMPDGGSLSISTGKVAVKSIDCNTCGNGLPGDFVRLSVTDSGTGMDEETLKNVFEPFYTTKDSGKGTGLGLATIHGIVHQNQGHIHIESTPGAGTSFSIYLPASEDPAASLETSKDEDTASCSETVLLVEDKEIVRKLVRKILRKQGYKVIEACNGGEAFLKYEADSGNIDVLLTDVIMPEMSGRQLYERLLQINPELKALFMSGYTEDTIASHGILEENINFIQKPFRPQELASKLRQVITGKI